MIGWGTKVDGETVMRWMKALLGVRSEEQKRLLGMLPSSGR